MADELKQQIARLNDVDLVRMLTRDADQHSSDALAAAEIEAQARTLPIDEAFLPADDGLPSAQTGQRFEVAGVTVTCPHCGNTSFDKRHALLNTRGMTLLRLDWLNREAAALVCERCGLVQFFAAESKVVDLA